MGVMCCKGRSLMCLANGCDSGYFACRPGCGKPAIGGECGGATNKCPTRGLRARGLLGGERLGRSLQWVCIEKTFARGVESDYQCRGECPNDRPRLWRLTAPGCTLPRYPARI